MLMIINDLCSLSNNLCNTGTRPLLKLNKMEDSYARLLKAAKMLGKADNPAEIARLIEVSDQTIQNWKTRGVPNSKLLKIEEKIGALPKWIATGEGDMKKPLRVDESSLTTEQQQMLMFMDEVSKEARDILLRLGKILSKHATKEESQEKEELEEYGDPDYIRSEFEELDEQEKSRRKQGQ